MKRGAGSPRGSWLAYAAGFFRRVEPAEQRDAAGAFLTLFGFMMGHALLETARDALFLARLPASQLPWVYLVIAVVALVLAERQSVLLRRFSSRNELSGWLLFAATGCFGFWLVSGLGQTWVFYAIYVWTGVLATLVVVRFWTHLGTLFTVTQAKRVFTVVGSGSVLGAIAGSAVARGLTDLVPPRHLLLAAAVVLLATSPAPRLLRRAATRQMPIDSGRSPLQAALGIWGDPYMKRIAILIVLAAMTFSLVDYLFKSAADRAIAPPDLASFFATVYLTLNLASLVVQLGVVSWLVRRFGLNRALAFVPALLLLGASGLAAGGGLAFALIMKGVDGSLRHSLFRTGSELLFVAIPIELRMRAKPIIDMLGHRGGQVVASLSLLVLLGLGAGDRLIAVVAVSVAALWLALTIDLRSYYLDVFRGFLDADFAPSKYDLDRTQLANHPGLLGALTSPDAATAIAALELLAETGAAHKLGPEVFAHSDAQVLVKALDSCAEAGMVDAAAIVSLLRRPEEEVRVAAYRAAFAVDLAADAIRPGLEDPSPHVRSLATAWLVSQGESQPPAELEQRIKGLLAGDAPGRWALARALREDQAGALRDLLGPLLDDPHPTVRREAIRSVSRLGDERFSDRLIECLAARSVRREARAALAQMGPAGVARMTEMLRDPAVPHAVRRHLPDAIAGCATMQAARTLVGHLRAERDGMIRFKILQALGRMRRRQHELPLDNAQLRLARDHALRQGFEVMRLRRALENRPRPQHSPRLPSERLLIGLLRDKQDHAVERVFRLLNLETKNDDFYRIYKGLSSPTPEGRASALELLEHLLGTAERIAFLEVVEDLFELDGGTARPARPGSRKALVDALRTLMTGHVESLSALAAACAADLGLSELEETIDAATPHSRDAQIVLGRAKAVFAGEAKGWT